ncbi:MAG: hypothetical protein V3S41_01380 [Spirochaetia bacterium]
MILRDKNSEATVGIRPECGGTVDEIRLHAARDRENGDGGAHDDPVSVIVGDPDPPSPGSTSKCKTQLFRGRILAPWNDRIPGGIYRFADSEYELTINDTKEGDALHGFLYRLPLDVRPTGTAGAAGTPAETLLHRRLCPSDEPGYPHDLDLLLGSPAVDDLLLELDASRMVPVGSDLLLTGGHESISDHRLNFHLPHPIGPQSLDIAYRTPNGHTTRPTNGRVVLEITQSKLFQYTQLYIPPDRRSIAIEPVSAATNAFNIPNLGLKVLESGDSVSGTMTATLHEVHH